MRQRRGLTYQQAGTKVGWDKKRLERPYSSVAFSLTYIRHRGFNFRIQFRTEVEDTTSVQLFGVKKKLLMLPTTFRLTLLKFRGLARSPLSRRGRDCILLDTDKKASTTNNHNY